MKASKTIALCLTGAAQARDSVTGGVMGHQIEAVI